MKKQKKHLSKLITLLLISLSSASYSQQLITDCGYDFHGVGEADIECPQSITVTSTESEGIDGTIISGLIYSHHKVTFIPGYSKVRIVPVESEDQNQSQSQSSSPPPTDPKRTKAGTGGKTGDRTNTNKLTESKNTINLSPNSTNNTVILQATSNLKTIHLYSINGKVYKQQEITKNTNTITIDITSLKKGLYIIKTQLNTGETVTKKIFKQ